MIADIPKELMDEFDAIEMRLREMPYGAVFIKHMFNTIIELEVQAENYLIWKDSMEKLQKMGIPLIDESET